MQFDALALIYHFHGIRRRIHTRKGLSILLQALAGPVTLPAPQQGPGPGPYAGIFFILSDLWMSDEFGWELTCFPNNTVFSSIPACRSWPSSTS